MSDLSITELLLSGFSAFIRTRGITASLPVLWLLEAYVFAYRGAMFIPIVPLKRNATGRIGVYPRL